MTCFGYWIPIMVVANPYSSLGIRRMRSRFYVSDDNLAMRVGITLASVVIILVCAHIFFGYLYVKSGKNGFAFSAYLLFNLGYDRSLPEIFNHGMLFFSTVLFLLVNYETRSRLALFLVALFLFAWLDDSAQYHERMGATFAEHLNLSSGFGLRAVDIGELLAWALAAALLSFLAIWAYRGRRNGDGLLLRLISLPVTALLICAVVFDMIHVMVQTEWSDRLVVILEDGGEMLAVAAIATVALAVARNPGRIWYQK